LIAGFGHVDHSMGPDQGNNLSERTDLPTFDEIYEAYAENILNYVYRLTGNKEDARDLTQDIFFKVLQNIDKFQHKSHIYTWIYQIATNNVRNHLKRKRRYSRLSFVDTEVSDLMDQDRMEAWSPMLVTAPSPQCTLEESERDAIVRSAIESLPFKYRVPLELRYYAGMSYKDIAKVLKISLSVVETRIHRAKKQLVKKLKPYIQDL
jgi:RNA polymerase sigma-70 factor, ECF subfamily